MAGARGDDSDALNAPGPHARVAPAPEGAAQRDPRPVPKRMWDRLSPWLSHPRLGLRLALCALLLSCSALWLGFYADDVIFRYIHSDRPGAARLFSNYAGGFGLALGDPGENQWQKEAGWAPWWHYDRLLVALYRPLSVLSHALDFRLWPDSPLAMHAHNLLWLVALVLAMTWMYRALLGGLLGGAAALLFAFDHSHGFAVGHIGNRHALIALVFGALCLGFHVRRDQRRCGSGADPARVAFARSWQAPLLYLTGILTSESTSAFLPYLLAYALFVEGGGWRERVFSVAPYLAITAVWRVLYNAGGYGASGSGMYIDVGREPLRFAAAFLERAPILWLGQFLGPPAEAYVLSPPLAARAMFAWALLVAALSLAAFAPLWRREPLARCFGLGMLGALIPAAATYAHNRQLMVVSVGAAGLLAQLWQGYARETAPAPSAFLRWGKRVGLLFLAVRLFASPVSLPFATASIGLSGALHRATAAMARRDVGGRDLIFVTAPEYYSVRLVKLIGLIEGAAEPRTMRTISTEPDPIALTRVDVRTLEVHYARGILRVPMQDDLHRDRRLRMPAGTKVPISGFAVEVLHATPDGRPDRVRFTFDRPLEQPSFAFYRWDEARFVPFSPPALGAQVRLPGARIQWGF